MDVSRFDLLSPSEWPSPCESMSSFVVSACILDMITDATANSEKTPNLADEFSKCESY